MGQSNMAAGATIGSNHNSRSADGELIAGRGFWPALCVSLKHNSKFASFNLLAKGDYPAELNIPIPFSLVSNELSRDELLVMPAYWFLHDLYALARNAWKYNDRDKRKVRTQLLEYDFLAPDSTREILDSIHLLELFTGKAYAAKLEAGRKYSEDQLTSLGRKVLEGDRKVVDALDVFADNFEHSKRKVRIIKVYPAYHIFKQLITYHAANELLRHIFSNWVGSLDALRRSFPARMPLISWVNMGGQLVQQPALDRLIQQIEKGKVKGWSDIHQFYGKEGEAYPHDRLVHACAIYREASGIDIRKAGPEAFKWLLQQALATREWITKGIHDSRAKDYVNPFRKMVYENTREMNKVTGSLEQNTFIRQEIVGLEAFRRQVRGVIKKFKL
jgi:hypothetical protein